MSDEQHTPLPDDLLAIKDMLFAQWHALPPEHQATVLLACLKDVVNGTMGEWFATALLALYRPRLEVTVADHTFPIVTHAHLTELAITNQDLASISPDNLIDLNERLRRHYIEDLFWDELAAHTEDLLTEKRHKQRQEKGPAP